MTTIDIRPARDRSLTRTPWLNSRHSFSFATHHDPANTHHGLLLVNNDDVVAPGTGFDTHPHRDMEIVTWVLDGSLVHQDSTGHSAVSVEGLQVDIADVGPFERSIATDRLIVACPLRSSPGQVAENGITAVLADRELEGGFTAAHGRRPSLRDVNQARTTMRRAQLVLKLPLRRRPRA